MARLYFHATGEVGFQKPKNSPASATCDKPLPIRSFITAPSLPPDEIDRRNRRDREDGNRRRAPVPLEDRVVIPSWNPEGIAPKINVPDDETDRGVVILEFGSRKS